MVATADAIAMANNPAEFFDDSLTAMGSLPREDMLAMQLIALQHRFDDLKDQVPILSRLAKSQSIDHIDAVEDVIPLLFEHSMYKSYPRSFLENYQFSQITNWLDKLTAHDLSGIDVSGCKCIDDWLDLMELESPLCMNHSSGTTGTMSFIPHGQEEADNAGRAVAMEVLQNFGEEKPEDKAYQVIFPHYRSGHSSMLRGNDQLVKWIAKCEENFHTAFPYKMSSDILYLGARLRHAQATGTLDRLEISDDLLARRKEFEERQQQMPAILDQFFEHLFKELKGERIYTVGTWNLMLDLARKGLSKGLEAVFAPDSIVVSGGGAKGLTPPDNWKEEVARFVGVPRITMNYAMSEVKGHHKMCSHGRYHVVPWVIPFVLDPDTSEPLPRTGVVTGRAAFFGLLSRTHWGGLISGDEITIDWDSQCGCGQTTYHLDPVIERYSEKIGDEDKITCAATPNAHRDAMEFLSSYQH